MKIMKSLNFRQVHLDFHTSEQICEIGKYFDAEEFARTLKIAGVDSVTCFARCHHGMIYYYTNFEAQHPHLQRNLLREQIEACHRYGIKVPIYITVGWDEFSASRHPEWLERDICGKTYGPGSSEVLDAGWHTLCFNTPYVDYVIAQTEEVLDLFKDDVDGLFFDIVCQDECFCGSCMQDMLKQGYNPELSEDRRMFANMVNNSFKKRMTDAIRAKDSKCTIFYNAGHVGPSIKPTLDMYTHLELESLPSGGYGYEHFPITTRYARNLGLPFVGMTGKFMKSWADFGGFKNPAALEYECFSALALGGGCSIGDQLHPSGKITQATYELIGDVYRQVEKKQPWCKDVVPVTEIGIITPEVVTNGGAFELSDSASGIHRMLSERHYQYDFIDFDMDLSKYRVVALPDIIRLTEEQSIILNKYLQEGGKLLVSYESGMGRQGYDFVVDGMPAVIKGESPFSPDYLVAQEPLCKGILATEHVMYERGFELEPMKGAKVLADVWKPYFERSYKHFCSHFHTPAESPAGYPGIVANDNIAYIGYPIFGMYKRHGARVYRDMVVNAIKLLIPDEEKLITTNAPTTADITINYQPKEDRYVLHVLNYIPERRYKSTDTIEDVPLLLNVDVDILLPDGYYNATLVPENLNIASTRFGKRLKIMIPHVRGHAMISFGKKASK